MREAAIGGLSAFDAVRPRKGMGGAGRPGPAKRPTGRGARFRRLRARAALIVGSAGLSAIMIGIVLNATVMQKGHHPAPLFAAAPAPVPRPVDPPVPASASPPTMPAAPQPDPIATTIQAPPDSTVAAPAAKAPAHTAVAARKGKAEDGIARLLAGEDQHHARTAHPRPATSAASGSAHRPPAPAKAAAPIRPVQAAPLASKTVAPSAR